LLYSTIMTTADMQRIPCRQLRYGVGSLKGKRYATENSELVSYIKRSRKSREPVASLLETFRIIGSVTTLLNRCHCDTYAKKEDTVVIIYFRIRIVTPKDTCVINPVFSNYFQHLIALLQQCDTRIYTSLLCCLTNPSKREVAA
jgi:hypothetical protein